MVNALLKEVVMEWISWKKKWMKSKVNKMIRISRI